MVHLEFIFVSFFGEFGLFSKQVRVYFVSLRRSELVVRVFEHCFNNSRLVGAHFICGIGGACCLYIDN